MPYFFLYTAESANTGVWPGVTPTFLHTGAEPTKKASPKYVACSHFAAEPVVGRPSTYRQDGWVGRESDRLDDRTVTIAIPFQ